MPRKHSIKTGKQKSPYRNTRRGRFNQKKAEAGSAKNKAADSTPPPPAAESTKPPTTSMSLLRRGPHLERKLMARLRKVEKKQERFEKCEAFLKTALAELKAAKTQIGELNTAVDYLLSQQPHNGTYFDRNRMMMIGWPRSMWECPVQYRDEWVFSGKGGSV